MNDRNRIDATELNAARLSPDGSRLILLLRDGAGQSISLSLPVTCLNALLTTMPRTEVIGTPHQLDTWSMIPAENGRDMILTLRTPDGLAVSFAIKPWQVQGMATVATFGRAGETPPRSIH